MRLLRREKSGWFSKTYNFSLTTCDPRKVQYAILSHRWGPDEVTFKDIENGIARTKTGGYKKLQFCAEQAASDGLLYFWIDTCCIDKSSSAELSEAINSMFKWYKYATKCYVYLPDVPAGRDWESAFWCSEWFDRGWTLQELIAPAVVEFFSVEGIQLGDRKSLEEQIRQITGIASNALQGRPLCEFSEKERFSWTARRQTTVEEDAVYCLLGIFDIQMPLIYGEGKEKALNRLQREIKWSSPTDSFVAIDAPWIVPFERNQCFTGRETQLIELERKLFTGDSTTRLAIVGLGGVGKTQLVLELLYRLKEKNKTCSIIWIPATTIEALQQGYLMVAQQLEIPKCEDEEADVKKLVQDHLSKDDAGPWLLVFDNADDIDLWITKPASNSEKTNRTAQGSHRLIDYLPTNKQGCIVFTTRDRRAAVKFAHQNIVTVPEMSEETATQLLKKTLNNFDLVEESKDVSRLLSALTYLPLAITQAAAYINANLISLAEYLSLLEEKEDEVISLLSEDFEDLGRYQNIKNPIATTWLISFERIRQSDPLAAEYLSFMACVNPKEIPQSLLPPGPSKKKEIEAIGTLTAYSFVSRRPVSIVFDLHRLVHLVMRNWLQKEELLSQWTEKTVTRLEEVFPSEEDRNRTTWRLYLPHVRQVLESGLDRNDRKQRINLMTRCARCLKSDGRWAEAENIFTDILAMKKKMLGEDDFETLYTMAELALIYHCQGRQREAEQLQIQVMEIRKAKLGDDHLDTLRSKHDLAMTYYDQGKVKEAKELQEQVLENGKTKLSADDLLAFMSNLSQTYWGEGRYDEAEQLYKSVLEIRKTKFEANDRKTLIDLDNLATTYMSQGRFEEAERLKLQVVEASKLKLGVDHPDTLMAMDTLALTYRNQGRSKEAEQLQLKVLETGRTSLGADHPAIMNTLHNLAVGYYDQGRLDEAEQIGLQVIEFRRMKLGADHPNTLASMDNLALVYLDQDRLEEAEHLHSQVLELRKTKLGVNHPHTWISMGNLAYAYHKQGRMVEAEQLEVQVMQTRRTMLGIDHPDTLTSMQNHARTLKHLDRDMEAVQLMKDCFKRQTQTLGAEHPSTLWSQELLETWGETKSNTDDNDVDQEMT